MKKNTQRGITLVALVITIIILLILAGISISALTNQGLFTQAQNAKNLTEEKTAEENVILTNYLEQMNAIIGGQVTESIPDGATVTPINDITTWLKTAGISKQYSYTTIEQVISDSTCTESLMNNENAMKYLARSTEFADEICASETAMTYLGQSEYVDNTVLNSDIWVEEIKASPHKWSVLESPVVPWSTASDSDIEKMLDAYYNGDITIDDIKTKNAIGDTRPVALSAMSAIYVSESHSEQTVEFAIADFQHDELTTPINGHTKAAVTLTQVNPLKNNSTIEGGYMNSNTTNIGGWAACARRTWCNNVYYNSLPSTFKSMVKEVNKLTFAGNSSTSINTTSDKIFLLSEVEVFGEIKNTLEGEGTQYEYYKTQLNRIKSNVFWWGRSPQNGNGVSFFDVQPNGTTDGSGAQRTEYNGTPFGIVPNVCI